jgi:hypothetical protein
MRALRYGVLGLVLLAAGGPQGAQADTPEDYLTRDGKLIRELQIDDLQAGAAGLTGTRFIIAPSGAWQTGRVKDRTFKAERSGTLSAKQLEALVRELARFNLKTLKSPVGVKRPAMPHLLIIRFGRERAELALGPDAALPKTDPKTIPGRFGGVIKAVDKLLVAKGPGG